MTFKARPEATKSTKGKVLEGKKPVTAPRAPNRVPPKTNKGVLPKTPVRESVAFLIESELERAEVVLAAKAVTTKLQDFAESLSTMEAKDIMPMMDSLRETFGPQAADQFSQIATSKIRELIGAVQASKGAIDGEIGRLEQMVNGGDPSDVAAGAEPPPPDLAGAAPPPGDDVGAPPGDEALPPDGGAGPEGELPPDPTAAIGAAEEDPAMGATGFAGRARKESVRMTNKGRRLTEENAADDSAFKESLNKLSTQSPKCYVFAHDILDSIHDLSVSGDVRNKLMKALGHIVAMAATEDAWDDPESVAELGVTTHFVDVPSSELIREPEVAAIVKNLRKFSHMLALMHSGDLSEDEVSPPSATLPAPAPALAASPLAAAAKAASPLDAPPRAKPSILTAGRVFENRRAKNVKRLRESANPDKMILTVFRNVFKECHNATQAVHGTARAFSIDAIDVVSIIREAKSQVDEEAVPSLMGEPMGQADPAGNQQNPNPALMGQNPTAATPVPGQPNKPMTPSDMRSAKINSEAADKAAKANNQPNAPITAPKNMAPVQQVKPGQQQVQPVGAQSPQMQQQQNANRNGQRQGNQGKQLPTMPGKVVNQTNMRTM